MRNDQQSSEVLLIMLIMLMLEPKQANTNVF